MMAKALRTLVFALALDAVACTSFPDASSVTDLRVLAVETDPSEVFLKITGLPSDPAAPVNPLALGIDPTSIPAITLRPLIVDPRAESPALSYDLSACPNNPYGPTPPGSIMGGGATDPGGGANNTVGSTLCDDAAISWPLAQGLAVDRPVTVPLTTDILVQSFRRDVFLDQAGQPHGGFDLGMPLNLELTVHEAGARDVRAIKRAVFWARTFPAQRPNQIPVMSDVAVFSDRDDDTFDLVNPKGTLDGRRGLPAAPAHTSIGAGLWLKPEGATAELYDPIVMSRDPPYQAMEAPCPMGSALQAPPCIEERLRYAYYATAGHFDPAFAASQLAPGAVGTVHVESHYLPPATLDEVPVDAETGLHLVTVWVVVRDDRGGESWVTGKIALDP